MQLTIEIVTEWVATASKLPVIYRRKVRITSSRHDPYGLGYTRVTMATTKGSNGANRSESQKSCLSSDCSLQLESMKVESLVIVDQHATVNLYLGLVLPARHAPGVEWLRSLINPSLMLPPSCPCGAPH
jgi:hypothetical protein